ncbi:MAG: hypothetical protein MK212_19520 [Saprospiraceae bacterium]|nr:hypothetical protein [Saprospiraceae bacterium]
MPFKKNNKYGKGRPKGSPNKNTEAFRSKVEQLLNKLDDSLDDDLQQLTPIERVKMYIQLLEYVTPKLKRIEQEPKQEPMQELKFVVINSREELQER